LDLAEALAAALLLALGVALAAALLSRAPALVAVAWLWRVGGARRAGLTSLAWLTALTAVLVVPVWVVLGPTGSRRGARCMGDSDPLEARGDASVA